MELELISLNRCLFPEKKYFVILYVQCGNGMGEGDKDSSFEVWVVVGNGHCNQVYGV